MNCAGTLDGKELFTIEGSENWRSTSVRTGGARKCRISRRRTPIRDLFHLRLFIRSSELQQVVDVVTQTFIIVVKWRT